MKYFISGHRDITEAEFNNYYVPVIKHILDVDAEATFVVGDYHGVDIMAQNFLVACGMQDCTTVYHMFTAPRNHNVCITKCVGGFQTDEERDSAMTKASDFDIAFVRKGRWDSGTAQNIKRRATIRNME